MFDVFITTNGPGEITTWVAPFVKRLKKEIKEVRISLFIVPCRFKTGTEADVAKEISEIDYIFSAEEFTSRLVNIPFTPSKKGCVVFLGGDLAKAALLKKRYGFRAIAYTEGDESFKGAFDKIFKRDIDGDLMFSFFDIYIKDTALIKELKTKKNIVFFPGSRPEQFKVLFPLWQKVSRLLPADFNCLFNISSFIPDEIVSKNKIDSRTLNIYRNKTVELMETAKLAITIPGTNNIQLAYLQTPSLITFPFSDPKVVNFPGIIGLLANIPGFRKQKKLFLLRLLDKKTQFTSLVNSKNNREIFPELRGELTVKQIAIKIEELANSENKLKKIKENCASLSKESLVLDKMIEKVKTYNV